jgi:hypothetical protein
MKKSLTERLGNEDDGKIDDEETEIAESVINKYISQLVEAYGLSKRLDANTLKKIQEAFVKYYHRNSTNEIWKKHCNGRAKSFFAMISSLDDSQAHAVIDWISRYSQNIKFFKFERSEDKKVIELLKNYDGYYKTYYKASGESDKSSEMLQTILDLLSLGCYQVGREKKELYRFLNDRNTIECIVEYSRYGRKILDDVIAILENAYFWLSERDFYETVKSLQEINKIDKGQGEGIDGIKALSDKLKEINNVVGRKIEENETKEKEKSKILIYGKIKNKSKNEKRQGL